MSDSGRQAYEQRNQVVRSAMAIPDTEWSMQFLQGMVDRMGLSWIKYGLVAEWFPKNLNALECLQLRLAKYAETGNTEYLMDAANFAMIEFMHPRNPNAFFKPTDSDGSPGRVRNTGAVDAERNTEAQALKQKMYRREGD